MEKELNLWVEDMKRECVLIDDTVLYQKILHPNEDDSKGRPKISGHQALYCNEGMVSQIQE